MREIIYFTDPICSSCWGVDSQLKKLKLEYGHAVIIKYYMGGLLPSWEQYSSKNIKKPSDVAIHWDEVADYYDIPISGKVWNIDPLHSSYPPCVAYKAAELQDTFKALELLKRLKEMVFLEFINISKDENIFLAAETVGLELNKFQVDYYGNAKTKFNEDLEFGKKIGIKGYPTFILFDDWGNEHRIYGSRPYYEFENAIKSAFPEVVKQEVKIKEEELFEIYNTITTKDIEVIFNSNKKESETLLYNLEKQNLISSEKLNNKHIWKKKVLSN